MTAVIKIITANFILSLGAYTAKTVSSYPSAGNSGDTRWTIDERLYPLEKIIFGEGWDVYDLWRPRG